MPAASSAKAVIDCKLPATAKRVYDVARVASRAKHPRTWGGGRRCSSRPAADELEALRLEIEALRKSLQATRERVRVLEDEMRTLKGERRTLPRARAPGVRPGQMMPPGAPALPPAPPSPPAGSRPTKPADAAPVAPRQPLDHSGGRDSADSTKPDTSPFAPPVNDGPPAPASDRKRPETVDDPLGDAQEALKKLRKNPNDKQAAEALERAMKWLKEREKPGVPGGADPERNP